MSEKLQLLPYSLERVSEGTDHDWKDQSGCSWSSPTSWFFIDILGGCGCGLTESEERAVALLENFAAEHADRKDFKWDVGYEILAHWFDSHNLIEHGSGITGSWLTDKGREIYEVIQSTK